MLEGSDMIGSTEFGIRCGVEPQHETIESFEFEWLGIVIPKGRILCISSKSFVDDLILGRGDVSFLAVLRCELLNPIPI